MKKYLECTPGDRATHIRIEVYYDKGGYNPFTGGKENRGYYLAVTPIKREIFEGITLESVVCFSGAKLCLKEAARRSEKTQREAESLAPTMWSELLQYVCNKNGLEVLGND